MHIGVLTMSEELLNGDKEDLHTDLQEALHHNGPFGKSISHPLVQCMLYSPMDNMRLNKLYEYKTKALAEARKVQDWGSFVFLHERPWRMEAVLDILHNEPIKDMKEFWQTVGTVWTDSENIWQYMEEWEELFDRAEQDSNSIHFMDEEEREAYKRLPKRFTIYRGYHNDKSAVHGGEIYNKYGFSYSLDKEKAEWFAGRFQRRGRGVLKRTVDKKDVFAIKLSRQEKEIIIFPRILLDDE
jgi:hypothetical protein